MEKLISAMGCSGGIQGRPNQFSGVKQWESHDARWAAFDALNHEACMALNGIGTRFAHGLIGGNVSINFDNSKVVYTSSTIAPNFSNANILGFNFSNINKINPVKINSMKVVIYIDLNFPSIR